MNTRDIFAAVSQESGVGMDDLLGPSHRWAYAWPRQLAYLLLRERGLTWHQVRIATRRKDHTTIIQGVRAARDRLLAVPAYKGLHDRVVARLGIVEAAE